MTTLEKIARAQFEAWRVRMTEDGEHEDDLKVFEDLSEHELDFAFRMARVAVETLRTEDPIPEFPEWNLMLNAILAEVVQ